MSFLPKKQKSLSEFLPRGIDVLRTGIEPYMIISYLHYLQAVLQAEKDDFCKNLQLLIIRLLERQLFGRLNVINGFLR